jgi:hypothetical protein
MKKALLLIILMAGIYACGGKKEVSDINPDVPFPADSDLVYYQAQYDSGLQQFWGDIKALSSAFLNNSQYVGRRISFKDLRIVSEGLFTGYVEVNMGDTCLVLKLIRKNQKLGKRCIWQVVDAREVPCRE